MAMTKMSSLFQVKRAIPSVTEPGDTNPNDQSCIKYSTNKYQYQYQYQWSKYQYKYQYLTFKYQYQYQYKYCA